MRRIAGDGRLGDLRPDELDDFSSEVDVRPRVPPAVSIFESVPAYPEETAATPAVASTRRRRPHLVSSVWHGACAVVWAPFALVAFVMLRIYWLAWWAVYGMWRSVTGLASLVVWTLRAIAHGIQRAIVGAISAIVGAVLAAVRGVRRGLSATCAYVLRGVASLIALTVRTAMRGVYAVHHACATVVRATVLGVQRAIAAIVGGCAAAAHGLWDGVAATGAAVIRGVNSSIALTVRTVRSGSQAVRHAYTTVVHATVHAVQTVISATAGAAVWVSRGVGHGVSAAYAHAVQRLTFLTALAMRTARRGAHAAYLACTTVARATVHGIQRTIAAIVGWGGAVARGSWHGVSTTWTFARGSVATLVALSMRTARRGAHAAYGVGAVGAQVTVHGVQLGIAAAVGAGAVVIRKVAHGTLATCAHAVRSGTSLSALAIRTARSGSETVHHACTRVARATIDGVSGSATAARAALVTTSSVSAAALASPRLRIGMPTAVYSMAHEWTRPVVLRSAAVVGVIGLATAAVSLVPRTPAARPDATPRPTLVHAAAAVAAPPVALPARSEAVAPRAPRQPDRAVARPAVARVRPASDARPAVAVSTPAVNPDTVQAIWRETDTRSLDRALSVVRQATLAFRRCHVQMTAADQAVALCDVAQSEAKTRDAAWTIEFRRTDERWHIDAIAAR